MPWRKCSIYISMNYISSCGVCTWPSVFSLSSSKLFLVLVRGYKNTAKQFLFLKEIELLKTELWDYLNMKYHENFEPIKSWSVITTIKSSQILWLVVQIFGTISIDTNLYHEIWNFSCLFVLMTSTFLNNYRDEDIMTILISDSSKSTMAIECQSQNMISKNCHSEFHFTDWVASNISTFGAFCVVDMFN